MNGPTVLTWKWGNKYTADHVNILAAMVRRNSRLEHRFVCLTDEPKGIDKGIEIYSAPKELNKFEKMVRRVWVFSEGIKRFAGPRFIQFDLDMLILKDITDMLARKEDFIVWRCPFPRVHKYCFNPSMMMMTTGKYDRIWQRFSRDPGRELRAANNGWPMCEDQAIISHMMPAKSASWDERDGLYGPEALDNLPDNARIIGMYGRHFDPAKPSLQAQYPWIKDHWKH